MIRNKAKRKRILTAMTKIVKIITAMTTPMTILQ